MRHAVCKVCGSTKGAPCAECGFLMPRYWVPPCMRRRGEVFDDAPELPEPSDVPEVPAKSAA